jgi:HEAT repeat protein
MLDQAFEALKTYDWGVDPNVLKPIDDAIVSSHGDAEARVKLEKRLAAILTGEAPRAAKQAACRALRTIGTAVSVPGLAGLLMDKDLSHMARYALQVNPTPEAAEALLAALPKAPTEIKIGIASSLGARRKDVPTAPFASMLTDSEPAIGRAGALALGALGSPKAAAVLSTATTNDASTKAAIADGLLECAENLLASGSKAEAKAAYERILASNPSEAVKVASTLGVGASS